MAGEDNKNLVDKFLSFWHKSKTNKAIVIFAALIVIGLLGSGGNKQSSNVAPNVPTQTEKSNSVTSLPKQPTNTPTPTATPTPALTSQQKIANFEKDAQILTVADIYKSPNSYSYKSVIFTCEVSGFPKNDNGDVGGLNCSDPNDFGSNVQIAIDKDVDVTQINENDSLKVYGMGLGAIKGQNAFGGDITTGGVLGVYINDLTTGYTNY